jgi:hypothetical protein
MKGRAMGKRSDFTRVKGDFYVTPAAAVQPLLPFLEHGTIFIEPCAGAGDLVQHLEDAGMSCVGASDIEPKADWIDRCDALDDQDGAWMAHTSADMVITNPPWTRALLHPMIDAFRLWRPTWLLFDADWMHTAQAVPYLRHCHAVVSVGRVKWMPGSKTVGKDNAAWYLFKDHEGPTQFYGNDKGRT